MLLPHVSVLMKMLKVENWDKETETISVSRDGMIEFLRYLASESDFDEYFYLEAYPDVRKAVRSGEFKSGHDHYKIFGVIEGRLPSLDSFDHKKYLEMNDDVAAFAAVSRNKKRAAIEHFVEFGFAEGRNMKATDIASVLSL